MPSPIWTAAGLASETRAYRARVHRAVEAQHQASTMKLTHDLEKQKVLEEVLEAYKPPVPESARELHYLLFTPFRYRVGGKG